MDDVLVTWENTSVNALEELAFEFKYIKRFSKKSFVDYFLTMFDDLSLDYMEDDDDEDEVLGGSAYIITYQGRKYDDVEKFYNEEIGEN